MWSSELGHWRSSFEWLFLVPVKGGRWHIITQLAVYTTYVPLIYCLLGGYIYICYLPPFTGTRNNHWSFSSTQQVHENRSEVQKAKGSRKTVLYSCIRKMLMGDILHHMPYIKTYIIQWINLPPTIWTIKGMEVWLFNRDKIPTHRHLLFLMLRCIKICLAKLFSEVGLT